MKAAVVGSRGLQVENLGKYLPEGVSEIVSGGAKGIDSCAKKYAKQHNLKYTEYLPDYSTFYKKAPLIRNLEIIRYADIVLVFWDGKSRGTKFVLEKCMEAKIPVILNLINLQETTEPM